MKTPASRWLLGDSRRPEPFRLAYRGKPRKPSRRGSTAPPTMTARVPAGPEASSMSRRCPGRRAPRRRPARPGACRADVESIDRGRSLELRGRGPAAPSSTTTRSRSPRDDNGLGRGVTATTGPPRSRRVVPMARRAVLRPTPVTRSRRSPDRGRRGRPRRAQAVATDASEDGHADRGAARLSAMSAGLPPGSIRSGSAGRRRGSGVRSMRSTVDRLPASGRSRPGPKAAACCGPAGSSDSRAICSSSPVAARKARPAGTRSGIFRGARPARE